MSHGVVNPKSAYGYMKAADVLLMLSATHWAPSGGSVGVKELECLAAGSPVLCLGRPLSEIQPIIDGVSTSMRATKPDIACEFIREEYLQAKKGLESKRRGAVNPESVRKHAWHPQANQLLDILRIYSQVS